MLDHFVGEDEVEMNDTMLKRYATAWKWLQGLAICGCAIAFCPVWWGNDWSQASVLLWIRSVAGIVMIVWLSNLSSLLRRNGHEIHSALLLMVIMPLTIHTIFSFGRQGAELYPSTLHGVIDQYFWGYPGLIVAAGFLALTIIGAIGRKSSWQSFRTLGPERRQDATS